MFDVTKYIPIIWEYLGLKLSYNTGIAFSLPIRWVFLQIITILILLGLGYYYLKEEYPKRSSLLDMGYGLILAWALSHAYERIFIGHVVDFISVKYFAILNFADIFISVWALLIIFAYVRLHRTRR
jgi:signal peptidase II